VIQLTRTGLVFSGTPADLRSLRQRYDQDHYVILPQLFEPSLWEEIVQRVEAAPFVPREHQGIGLESCMEDPLTAAMMMFFPNNPAFLRLVEQITGQPRIGQFMGRVYQMNPSQGHYDSWHDDSAEQRVATMSINLSRQAYSGGALQMKYRASEEILREIHNAGFGDALIFRISDDLKHRVQAVTGSVPKIAFAGWFLDAEDMLLSLRRRARIASNEA
jgi:hypothetical protein